MQKTVFSKRSCSWETTRIRFGKAGAHPQLARESQLPLKPCPSLQPLDFEGNCDSSDFLLDFCFVSIVQFCYLLRKCGLLAHTSPTFLKKLLDQKTFSCLRLIIGNFAPRETTRIRFGKAGAHPQLAWESQLPRKPCPSLQPLNFKGNCDSFDFLLDFCCNLLLTFLCRGQLPPV